MDLKNKTVVITGATGGMGREIVKLLDKEGANLVLISKSDSELATLVKSLNGKNNIYYSCNLADQKATQKLTEELAEKFKTIDVLINAAGIGVYKPVEEATLEEWNDTLNINLTSGFIITKGIIEKLKNSENSVVISIGSGMGIIPEAGRSLYCMSKFALRGWSLSLAEEFKGTKTDFCLVALGSVLTSFGPMSYEEKKKEMEAGKAYLTPDWVASKIVEIIKSDERQPEYKFYPSGYEPQI